MSAVFSDIRAPCFGKIGSRLRQRALVLERVDADQHRALFHPVASAQIVVDGDDLASNQRTQVHGAGGGRLAVDGEDGLVVGNDCIDGLDRIDGLESRALARFRCLFDQPLGNKVCTDENGDAEGGLQQAENAGADPTQRAAAPWRGLARHFHIVAVGRFAFGNHRQVGVAHIVRLGVQHRAITCRVVRRL